VAQPRELNVVSKKKTAHLDLDASLEIDRRIEQLGDWRGETLARVRALIHDAVPDVVEEWKWANPVFSMNGIICTGEAYKAAVKLTFPKGASLPDPTGLFNASLEGNARRAIDIGKGAKLNATAFKVLVKAAVALNAPKVRLLSGGNPQIAKAAGDAPVRAYIAALPGWKREACERLDKLIVKAVPNVKKAVEWNSPFYGVEGKGWFLAVHAFNRYLKVNFFFGRQLQPMPPVASKDKNARYAHVEEGGFDEAQMTKWVKQAARAQMWEIK
jgi:hypothetical protein